MEQFIRVALLGCLLLFFTIWYIQFHLKRRRLYKLAAEFNGPPTLPLIGNALKCWIPLSEVADTVLRGASYYTSPAGFWFGPYFAIHVWHPDDLRIVLNSPHALEKQSFIYGMVEMVTRRGLVTSPVEEWKRHRKLIAPIFAKKHMESFFNIFQCHAEKLITYLDKNVGNGIFDLQSGLVTYAMGSVLDTMLGTEDENARTLQLMAKWIFTMLEAITSRVTNIWYISDFIFNNAAIGKRLANAKKEHDVFMDTIIQKWEKASMEKISKSTVRFNNNDETLKPRKFIEHLLSASDGNGKFTVEEIRGEISTIVVAGMESTSSLVGFIMTMLGIHPDIQEKLYQEIKHVLGTKEELEYSDLNKLPYLEQVIKETLRIFPPGNMVMRYSTQEIQLKNHTIPAHTNIMIGVLSTHRDPKLWPNPTKFDPDRFLPEEEAKRDPYSWIPFSAGPRNCIGVHFAWMSLKTVMSRIILKYKIAADYKRVEDVRVTFMIVTIPTDGYRVSLSNR